MAAIMTSPITVSALGRRARRATGPVLSLLVCIAGLVAVAGPALRAGDAPVSGGHVTVEVLGQISTTGLPVTPAVSKLTVHNSGAAAFEWAARASVDGPGAAGVVIDAWVPSGSTCTDPTALLTATSWSSSALPAGASTALCVRVRAAGTASGSATPHVTVAARGV